MCVCVCVTREREVVVATISRYCRHQLHRCARNAGIPERRREREREKEGENGKDLEFWLEISEPTRGGTKKGTGGSLKRRISGTRVAAEAAAARQGGDPTQTARPRKIEMFGCLNVGVLSQHSSFHPSFPFPSPLAPCCSSRVFRSRAIPRIYRVAGVVFRHVLETWKRMPDPPTIHGITK